MSNTPKATIDFETRSACNIRQCGSWRYSLDPTTDPLCLAFRLPHWEPERVDLWHPAFPSLGIEEGEDWDGLYELLDWIDEGGLVEAHNAWFERGIWTNIMGPRYHFPLIPHEQWRCSAAKAASHALPRGLGDAVAALHLALEKDEDGAKLMLKMCKPRKPRKAELEAWANAHGAGKCVTCKGKGAVKKQTCGVCKGAGELNGRLSSVPPMPILYHESREQLERLWDYCRVDVLAEEALSEAIPDLSPEETQMFLMDQQVNERGFQLDQQAIAAALALVREEAKVLNAELAELTEGAVEKATQRDRMIEWFDYHGLSLENTQAATIDETLKRSDLNPTVRRGLELMRALGRSSTAKYEKMRDWACPDGRVRGGLLFHGASTGRWPITGDHELLTPAGWARLDEWQGGAIACWTPDGAVAFEESRRLQFELGPAERLVHWTNQKVDQLSTADHEMPVFPRQRRSPVTDRVWGGGFSRKRISDVSPGDRIPLCGVELRQKGAWALSAAQTRVLIMTQADAHYLTENGRAIRYRFKKDRKVLRCMKALRAAGVDFRMRIDECDDVTVITVPHAWAPDWLWAFQEKTFSWEWLNVDPELFFDELVQWDGSRSSPNGMEYTSTVRQNADVVQALAHLSGRTCRVRQLDRDGWSTAWRCGIDHDPAPVTFRKPQRTDVAPEGPYVYCAETPTGYFLVRRNGRAWITGNSGAGVQPHNFPKGNVKDKALKDQDTAWEILQEGDREEIAVAYDGVMEALSFALRGAIIATPGRTLYVADYAAIEARVLLWLAEDEENLDVFRRGEDIYLSMASDIYGYPCNKADHPGERALGKVAVLGLGYQMGASKFYDTCQKFGIEIDEDMAERVVRAYREKFWLVKQLWADQEAAAIKCVKGPIGLPVRCGRLTWLKEGLFLYMILPSGRRLAYPEPAIKSKQMPWGDWREQLTYKGVNPVTRKWHSQAVYGGLIVENGTQAIARDLMACAMLRCEESGIYQPVLSIHDEMVAEADEGKGSVEDFERMMAECPEWGSDIPVAAEGWSGPRYHK